MKLNLKAISEVISAVRDYLFPYEKISKNFLKNLENYKHVYDVKNSSKLLINKILNKKFKYDKKFIDLNI